MLLEKTLHMSQPVAECRARLASIQSYRRQFLMVTRATVTSSKTVDFSFRGPFGFEAHTVLLVTEPVCVRVRRQKHFPYGHR